jgi:hypothetical protein
VGRAFLRDPLCIRFAVRNAVRIDSMLNLHASHATNNGRLGKDTVRISALQNSCLNRL